MDTYVMSKNRFIDLIEKAVAKSSIYNLTDILNAENDELDIRGVQHKGYLAAITDLRSYYDANMELLNYDLSSQLISSSWPIYTVTTDSCPVHYYQTAKVKNSMVANGCVISGTVENSVIGRDVRIEEGAVVKNCVVLGHTTIKKNVHLTCQVVDKWAQVIHAGEITATPDAPGYIRRDDVI